jgi:hypothetical protein
MTEKQKAYLAGLVDGDGSIMLQLKRREGMRFLFRIKAVIVIYQDSKCYQETKILHEIIGYGYLYQRNDHINEIRIEGFTKVEEFLMKINPYLRFKKSQANYMLEALKIVSNKKYSINDFLRVCELSDKISENNYSSKNRKYTKEYVITELRKSGLVPVTTESL